jgi:hypothetical protein
MLNLTVGQLRESAIAGVEILSTPVAFSLNHHLLGRQIAAFCDDFSTRLNEPDFRSVSGQQRKAAMTFYIMPNIY